MLISPEHEKLWRYSNYESQIFSSKVRSADPPISVFYLILRIGGPYYNQGFGSITF